MNEYHDRLLDAVRQFWRVRDQQSRRQGQAGGQRDTGARSAVTGGKHLAGFVALCRSILEDAGLPDHEIHTEQRLDLPGYYRAEKKWDLVAVARGELIAAIEIKAQVGPSFGNNFNNRAEEAMGNATDLWAAYREGAFQPSVNPWLGYIFLLEDCEKSRTPVKTQGSHFPVFPEFEHASYARRYEILLTKLLRVRLYEGACLLLSQRGTPRRITLECPQPQLSFDHFAAGLSGRAAAWVKFRS